MSLRGMGIFLKGKYEKPIKGVEVGVWKGDNAAGMLNFLNIGKLYLVDPYEPYMLRGKVAEKIVNKADEGMYLRVKEKFSKDKRVKQLRMRSPEAARKFRNKTLDFVYIDGCHNYEAVIEDIKAWYPKVKMGGVLGGHDYCEPWDGVIKAVNEILTDCELYFNGSDWWIIKNKEALSE